MSNHPPIWGQHPYEYLSSMFLCEVPATIELNGKLFTVVAPSLEHAYQIQKTTTDQDYMRCVLNEPNPYAVKQLGNKALHSLRPNWDAIRLSIYYNLVLSKYAHNPQLQAMLVSTYPHTLTEQSDYGDKAGTFWGQHNGKGFNWAGRLTMLVRSQAILALSDPPSVAHTQTSKSDLDFITEPLIKL